MVASSVGVESCPAEEKITGSRVLAGGSSKAGPRLRSVGQS